MKHIILAIVTIMVTFFTVTHKVAAQIVSGTSVPVVAPVTTGAPPKEWVLSTCQQIIADGNVADKPNGTPGPLTALKEAMVTFEKGTPMLQAKALAIARCLEITANDCVTKADAGSVGNAEKAKALTVVVGFLRNGMVNKPTTSSTVSSATTSSTVSTVVTNVAQPVPVPAKKGLGRGTPTHPAN